MMINSLTVHVLPND